MASSASSEDNPRALWCTLTCCRSQSSASGNGVVTVTAATPAADVASLQAEVLRLRQENQLLRAQLGLPTDVRSRSHGAGGGRSRESASDAHVPSPSCAQAPVVVVDGGAAPSGQAAAAAAAAGPADVALQQVEALLRARDVAGLATVQLPVLKVRAQGWGPQHSEAVPTWLFRAAAQA